MKIAFDNQIFTIQRNGGISRYFINLMNALNTFKGVSSKVLCGVYQNEYYQKKHKTKYNFSNPLKTITLNRYLNNTLNFIDSIHLKPSVLHETFYFNPIPFKGKRVTTIHDLTPEKLSEYFKRDDFIFNAKSKAINRADHIFSVSYSTKKDLIEFYGVDEKKITVTHLGVSPFFKKDNFKSLVKEDYILYVGNREGYKNFNKLMEVIPKSPSLKKIKVVCFGGGEFSLTEKENLKNNNLDFLQIAGDDTLLRNLYNNAKFLVYPSLYEGFGLPVVEAMACGCPVVCSNTSSIPEVGGGAVIYFNPYNTDEMLHQMESILLSESLQRKHEKLGIKRSKNFTWTETARKTIKGYTK